MTISLKKALVYVPQNEKWLRRTLIGGLLLFFPTFSYIFPGIRRLIFNPINYYALSLFGIIAGVVFLAVCGYFFKAIHNRVVHDEEGLPSWENFLYYVYIGLKSYIGGFIFSLPFIAFWIIFIPFVPMGITKSIIPFVIIASIVHIIYSFLYTMVALNFTIDFKISSYWNYQKAYELIKGNMKNFVTLVAFCILLAFAHSIIGSILINAQIFALLIPFISFYICLVYADLFAQFILKEKEANPELLKK